MISYLKTKQFVLYLIIIIIFQADLKADVLYIIYTSNINGAIENCGCGSDPLGGLDKVKSVIDQFKRDNKNVFVIDGGDYFNSYPYPALNDAMYQALLLMNYDCLVLGDQEFVEGGDFFSKYASSLKNKILLSNGGSGYQRSIEATFGLNRIVIYGYLSPYIFDFISKPDDLNLSNFVNAKPDNSEDNQLQIAIIHGYLSNAEQFAIENTTIDLIFLSHDQRRGIWEKNNAVIVGNGKDSEYISVIKVSWEDKWRFNVDQMKINEDLPKDDQIITLIDEYKNK